ncbi:phage tail protein [Sporomusa sphaeroides DSM 2875]|uniref:phage tail protein n=1 Tax=Sporomusa sphaeroides TaxID=47679 RepID=UPI00202FF592|nr:phage tail protein [Sporomusa sphaeroides]MCM0759933.1 phage tail protein [Sporomusa sphaeroides DSM 2875]
MGLNAFTGWGLSTLALYFLNGRSRGKDEQSEAKAEELSITETKTGTPIPVMLGRTLIKSPLTIYYGDFRAESYTETYSAHAKFNAWPLVLSLIATYISAPATGHQATPATVAPGASVSTSGGSGQVTGTTTANGATYKDDLTGPLLNALFMWLLSWLINGRNLKTTIQKGFKYYLGFQQLVCWSSSGMRLRTVYLGQNKVWEGDVSRESIGTGPLVIKIDNDELFGGPDEGGGFIGELHVYLGGADQQADPWMIAQMQADSIQEELRGLTPAYRPFVSVVVPTAYIGKQATIPEIWLEMQVTPDGLGLGAIGEDTNPAESLYEIHVNKDWGLGQNPDLIDTQSLIAVGNWLKSEKLGITIKIGDKTAARTVIDAICDHVNMVRYQDPQTGRITYKLIRDDYDPEQLVRLNQSNCSRITFNRLDWRETVGEICVTYTDRIAQYEQSSINANDPSVIELAEGNKVTKTYDYPYFTTAENALWAAKRESYQQGYPLATGSIVGDRTLYGLRTGDVAILDWQPYGIKNFYIRITKVNLGDFVDGKITLEFMEDVFGLGKADYNFDGSTGWKDEVKYPTGVQHFRYLELPWEMIPDKDTHVFALAAQPDIKTVQWNIWRNKEPIGWTATTSLSKWTPTGRLIYALSEFADYIDLFGVELIDIYGLKDLESATLPNGAPDIAAARNGTKLIAVNDELIAWSSIERLPSGNWQIKGIIRGVYDTVPQNHAPGSLFFFLEPQTYANVTTGGPVCKQGLTTAEFYNITTTSVTHVTEEFDNNKVQQLTTTRRAERPNAPGCFSMSCWNKAEAIQHSQVAGDVLFSWVHRNKVTQTYGIAAQSDELEHFTQQEFDLPSGAHYVAKIMVGLTKVAEYTVDGKEFTYTWADRCRDSSNLADSTTVQVFTVQNGLESHQPQSRTFDWEIPLMIDACETVLEAHTTLNSWANSNIIAVPASPYADEFQRNFSQCSIFVLGTRVPANTPGSLIAHNGSGIIPNGQILVVTGMNSYDTMTMGDFYTFRSNYVWNGSGGSNLYVYHEGGVELG